MLMMTTQPAGIAPAGPILCALQPRSPEAVEWETFDPTEARCWLTRARSVEHANELARIWRAFPDLPATAPLDDRMARGRERIAEMKPLNDAISAAVEAERQTRNFALMEQHLADETIDDRELAVLRGRDDHGYDWDLAVAYASGWTAAHAGWEHRFYADGSHREATNASPMIVASLTVVATRPTCSTPLGAATSRRSAGTISRSLCHQHRSPARRRAAGQSPATMPARPGGRAGC